MTNITRISVLQLAVERHVRRARLAAGRRDLPAARRLVEEERAAVDLDRRRGDVDARAGHPGRGRQVDVEDRLLAGRALVLLELARGLLAQLGTCLLAVLSVQRRLEDVRDRGGVVGAVGGAAGRAAHGSEQRKRYCDRAGTHTRLLPSAAFR